MPKNTFGFSEYDQKVLTDQAERLSNQDLFGLVINKFYHAGNDHDIDLLHAAEYLKDILGCRLAFPIYLNEQASAVMDAEVKRILGT